MPKVLSQRNGAASLAGIQRSVAQVLMRPLTRADEMAAASGEIANRIIKPNDRLTSSERLQIYNQQYWWRLLANVGDDFPGVRAVLGQRRFDKLALAYLEQCGSTSWNLRNLGRNLENFLREHPEIAAPYQQLAMETARMEWACIEAFDGPARPPIDSQKIARLAPDRLRLKLQPYITLLEFKFPIDELLGKLKQPAIETGTASNAVSAERPQVRGRLSVRASRTPVHLVVHRVDFSVFYKRLEPEAFRLLFALRSGAALEGACEEAFRDSTELPESAAAKIQTWFATWMRFGWFCG